MFISITGKPGSGKSAYAVDQIITKRNEYHNIYANINGLKLDGNLKALNFNKLMLTVRSCKNIYDKQIDELGEQGDENIIDAPIVQFLIDDGFIVENPEYQIYIDAKNERETKEGFIRWLLDLIKPIYSVPQYKPTLIIIDEAQNHLPSKDRVTGKDAKVDPIIAWWISYHRHLFMDVLLLSQTYQKIHSTYLRDIEYFLYAVPSDRQLFATKFQYRHHTGTPFFKTNLVDTISIPKRKEIFEMYDSGDKVRTKSIIRKYVLILVALVVVVFILFGLAISYFSGDDESVESAEITTSTVSTVSTVSGVKTVQKIDYKGFVYIKLKCLHDECVNKKNNIELYIDDLNSTLVNTDSKIMNIKKLSYHYAVITLLASDRFINLFQGANNGKNDSKGLSILGN